MFFTLKRAVAVCAVLVGVVSGAQGRQAPKQDNEATPAFRSESRLVLFDVVVTDAAGHPIRGLKPQDFTVLEDGKTQTISAFDEQAPEIARPKLPAAVLPANEYTNYTAESEPGASTVVLVDAGNSTREDLANAREQLLRFVKRLPAGKQVAIYALTHGLTTLQSFTSDANLLTAAAERLTTRQGASYSDNRELSTEIGELKNSGASRNPAFFRAMVTDLEEQQESKLEIRTQDTFEAFAQLARSLAIVPGRKNLIWLSGGFPLNTDNESRLQRVSELLALSRIAVYPVDARGKVVLSAGGDVSSVEVFSQTDSYEDMTGLAEESMAREDSMLNLARLTGGRAYLGSNDLDREIADAVTTAASYYTIAYHSTNTNWNGRYRKLQVKVARPGAKELYRAGYYAVADPLKTKVDPDRAAAIAMYRGAPVSTQLIMKARVVPPSVAGAPVAIDMLVDAHAVTFSKSEDGHQTADLQFIAVATNAEGKTSGSFSEFFRQPVTKDQFGSLLKTGVQLHREMELPAGSYQLRLGVMDRLANRIGTLDVLLTVAAPPKK